MMGGTQTIGITTGPKASYNDGDSRATLAVAEAESTIGNSGTKHH